MQSGARAAALWCHVQYSGPRTVHQRSFRFLGPLSDIHYLVHCDMGCVLGHEDQRSGGRCSSSTHALIHCAHPCMRCCCDTRICAAVTLVTRTTAAGRQVHTGERRAGDADEHVVDGAGAAGERARPSRLLLARLQEARALACV